MSVAISCGKEREDECESFSRGWKFYVNWKNGKKGSPTNLDFEWNFCVYCGRDWTSEKLKDVKRGFSLKRCKIMLMDIESEWWLEKTLFDKRVTEWSRQRKNPNLSNNIWIEDLANVSNFICCGLFSLSKGKKMFAFRLWGLSWWPVTFALKMKHFYHFSLPHTASETWAQPFLSLPIYFKWV